jgi:DNA processing protein
MTANDSNRTAVILALASIGKIGPVKIKAILAREQNPTDVLNWDIEQFLTIPGIHRQIADRIKNDLDLDYGNKLIEWAEKNSFDVLTIVDDDYPASLKGLYDPPPFLFIKGNLTGDDDKAAAIVGSRNASEYGRATAGNIAGELSRHGVTIVSGMAIGVDSASHRGALTAGGRTIAVLGSGIDVIYPRENRNLYDQIANSGAVLSEFFPGTEPNPGNFPRRNRVIAGLSQTVIVIEAGDRSGALLTADLALVQGKKLFAVPGNLSSKLSSGTNELIKSGANLLTSIDDIFSVLPELKNDYIEPGREVAIDLTEGESMVIKHLTNSPKQLDALVRECGMPVSDATSYLLSLELRGLVKQLSGKRFITV